MIKLCLVLAHTPTQKTLASICVLFAWQVLIIFVYAKSCVKSFSTALVLDQPCYWAQNPPKTEAVVINSKHFTHYFLWKTYLCSRLSDRLCLFIQINEHTLCFLPFPQWFFNRSLSLLQRLFNGIVITGGHRMKQFFQKSIINVNAMLKYFLMYK